MDISQLQAAFDEAEQLHRSGDLESACARYLELAEKPTVAPLAFYKLAQISNQTNDPLTAKDLYYKAFSLRPDLCGALLNKNHPNRNYVFPGKKEEEYQAKCPLCGESGEAFWCYSVIEMGSTHVQEYNPVRVWMRCENCNHLYAEEFPEQKVEVSSSKSALKSKGMDTKSQLFPFYSDILNKLATFTKGTEFLEIGLGGSEASLVAQEMAFHVLGIDISEGNVLQARRYGIDAEQHDFMEFETERKWDVIVLGDVIEHVSNPLRAMEKVYELLDDNGVVWISTPNFEAAFSVMSGHNDPMRREASHKNYFSRHSFFLLLEKAHFIPVEYKVSAHYNGSMEVIVVKEGR